MKNPPPFKEVAKRSRMPSTKDNIDLQIKIIMLGGMVSKLEVVRPLEIGETSTRGQEGPSAQMSIVPYTCQEQV